MSRVCVVCERTPRMGFQVSHSHRRSKRRWNLNLQRKRVLVNGKVRRAYVCTRCLGSQKTGQI